MSRRMDSYHLWEQITCTRIKQIFFIIFIAVLLSFPSNTQAQLIHPHNKTLEETGDVILVGLPATAALSTVLLKDKEGVWQFTKSFATNIAITAALKYGINKERPFDGGGQAFPSGHTSITFQAASFIHRRYGFGWGVPAYALAGITAYSRINATKHDGYDILAGAVIGIGSSFIFTTPYQREHMKITFSSSEDAYLFGFRYRF